MPLKVERRLGTVTKAYELKFTFIITIHVRRFIIKRLFLPINNFEKRDKRLHLILLPLEELDEKGILGDK